MPPKRPAKTSKAKAKAKAKPGPKTGEKRRAQAQGGESSKKKPTEKGSNEGEASGDEASTSRKRNPDAYEIPEEAEDTQHFIRGISGLFSQTTVLTRPTAEMHAFEERYKATEDIRAHVAVLVDQARTPSDTAMNSATALQNKLREMRNPIATTMLRISKAYMAGVFMAFHRAGISTFHPDVFGPRESIYNQLHRHLAVSTFQFVTSGLALRGVDFSVVDKYHLMGNMFDNFVFGTLAKNSQQELRKPGSVTTAVKATRAYKHRAIRRSETAKELGYSLRLRKSVKDPALHSDDERDPITKQIHVRDKPGRAEHWTNLFLEWDEKAVGIRMHSGKRGPAPQERLRTQPLAPSALSHVLPEEVPPDYFAASFFNELSARERAKYVGIPAGLPPARVLENKSDTAWRTMAADEFEEKYGEEALKDHRFPTEEELLSSEDEDEDDEEDEEEVAGIVDPDVEMPAPSR
uniref:Uncharacterized protein n=1 Tax=Mycena chlorophos TaxID=658473 RepID=A0ABQ0L2I4_MYCCL|nr:predicted protein [Mycena chlorophos]